MQGRAGSSEYLKQEDLLGGYVVLRGSHNQKGSMREGLENGHEPKRLHRLHNGDRLAKMLS